ncbi:MBL fold metallo-hydrolase [Acinetobacter sp. MD2]|uniref:MBL fold metallo-hydrolase n=1 Tax=Acinetobacter sp. MD2 TaxID=2600066 RepID=UPI002D1F4E32|nr:MBL fold metallo-hydrolase [Acinetobacter sp. MD2]MEB3766847.1 MBL fold metallo-hydrolase [Acinetobacter sp. MD2]
MAKLTTFEVGYCTHPLCMVQQGAGLKACKFPAKAWLIEVNDQKWLWDTGYAEHFHAATRSGLFQLYRKMTPVTFNAYESIQQQLSRIGIEHHQINHVIISHFHADHIAGLADFRASQFICSKQAWSKTKKLRGIKALKRAFIPALIPNNFEQRVEFIENFEFCTLPEVLLPFTHGYALPNSEQQVFLVDLPGHAAGHIGAFVQTEQGWVLLASDAAWTKENYQNLKKPSRLAYVIMDDAKAYDQTLNKLHQLSKNDQVKIYLSHEGSQ